MQTDKKCVHDAADFFSREEEEAGNKQHLMFFVNLGSCQRW